MIARARILSEIAYACQVQATAMRPANASRVLASSSPERDDYIKAVHASGLHQWYISSHTGAELVCKLAWQVDSQLFVSGCQPAARPVLLQAYRCDASTVPLYVRPGGVTISLEACVQRVCCPDRTTRVSQASPVERDGHSSHSGSLSVFP